MKTGSYQAKEYFTDASLRQSDSFSPKLIRRLILDQSKRAGVGHIGSALSVADIIYVLYEHVLMLDGLNALRDRFILSKGHSALALYAALYAKGKITREEIEQYCADGAVCGVHPEHHLNGVDFSTGSLGHGLAFGAGVALAARMHGKAYRAFVLMSDAECNEGSVWESVMFASHHGLSNLTAIVDNNGQQALGRTRDVLNLEPLDERWRAFGWQTFVVDGHDVLALRNALSREAGQPGRPRVILANTVCGKGVSFMEGRVDWHYLPMSDKQYAAACREIEREVIS